MIFFLKADGTLINSAPDTVYQGSAEAGKIYVVAPLNAGMLVDVYYELPNGERWGAYLLENNGKVIDDADLPEGWALWSTSLASAITQYAGTLKAQFGFYQSGTADKVPLITSQAVAITIAKGVVRDLPEAPTTDVYEQILNALSSIKQDIANLPNEYLANTNEDKIALKNNKSIPYEKDVSGSTIVQRDEFGRIKALRGEKGNDVVNVEQLDERVKTFKYVGGPDDFTDINGGLTVKKGMSVDGPMKANTAPKADNEVVRLKELKEAEIEDLGAISDIDLNTGDTTVEYNTDLGITVNAKGTITRENGYTEQPTTKFEVPIVASDGIVIDKAQKEEKISVKVDGKVTKTPNSIVKRDSAGRVKTADAVSDEDAVSYGQHKSLRDYTDSELLKKFDRTGGTITGDLIVSGNLSVSGETSVIESTTLKVADKLIYVAKDNTTALTSPAGLITPKYDGTNDGGLVYDNSGTAYVGDIKLDSKGNVDVNNSDLQPIATRDDYSKFTNGHKVKAEVDSSQKSVKFVDGGKDDGINSLTDVNLTLGDTTVQYDTNDGIQLKSTGRFTYAEGSHDATIDLDIPLICTNGITIDKASDSEKIEISGKNFVKNQYFNSDPLAITDSSANAIRKLKNGYYTLTEKVTTGFPDNLPSGYYTIHMFKYAGGEGSAIAQSVVNNKMYVASFSSAVGVKGWEEIPNKKYADENYVKKNSSKDRFVYGKNIVGSTLQETIYYVDQGNFSQVGRIPCWITPDVSHTLASVNNPVTAKVFTPVGEADIANKKYVDDAIEGISSVTKYAHNLILEGTKDGYTFKVFMCVFRIDNADITTLDEVVTAVGGGSCPCTGYIYDGNQKAYTVMAFNASGPVLEYIDPESGGQEFAITADDVAIIDNSIEF